jgi:alkylation response protein AidB-like acyl-CoA dehydrogenase
MGSELKEAKKLLNLAASVEGQAGFLMELSGGRFKGEMLQDIDIGDSHSDDYNDLALWLDEYLTSQFDPVQVTKNSKVPDEALSQLSRRLLGVKIKKQYGGLELSTIEYCLIMRIISSYSPALGIWYTANCSIGLSGYLMVVYNYLEKELKETLSVTKIEEIKGLMERTKWQMNEFLPKLAAGANAGFGLTQITAGSDPMAMIGTDTFAERLSDGSYHVQGHKLYNTCGTIAKYEVIMAPLLPTNSICAFIAPTSGFGKFTATRCEFAGNRGMDNALIQFDVNIPENYIVGRDTGHEGFKNAVRTLNVGRLAMAAGSSAQIVNSLNISRWWCKERVQQKRPIGKFKKNSIRVAKMACDAFAVEAIMHLGCAMYDRHKIDLDMRLETAAVKLWSTERAVAAADTNKTIRSGRAYETYESQARRAKLIEPYEIPLPDDTFINDAGILTIGEGTSDIQRLIISGMMLAPHVARLMPIADPDSSLYKKAWSLAKAMFHYGHWIPTRIALKWFHGFILLLSKLDREKDARTQRLNAILNHSEYVKYMSNKLALKSLWNIVWHREKLLREQVITSFAADQLTELWVMFAVDWYALRLYPEHGDIVYEMADIHCSYARCRIGGEAENMPQPSIDNKAYKLGQKIIFENAAEFLEKGVATVLERELKRWA